MIVLPMVREIDVAWAFVPTLKKRIIAFCKAYDEETDGEFLARNFELSFNHDMPTMFAALVLDESRIVGHVICSVDEWCGKKYVTVVQLELDEKVPDEIVARGFEMINEFAKLHYAETLQLLTRNKQLERVFSGPKYGFEYKRSIMRKKVVV